MTETTTQAGPTGRLALLLTAIRDEGGEWTTVRVMRLYQQLGPRDARIAHMRSVARGDLRVLRAQGWLKQHDPSRRRFFTLNTRKDSE
jgi:hypothetical protein